MRVLQSTIRSWRSLAVSSNVPSRLPGRRVKQPPCFTIKANAHLQIGGSFGVVYKGIEKATGETVAIKHVRTRPALL